MKNMRFFYPLIVYFVVLALMQQIVLSFFEMDAVIGQAISSAVGGIVLYVCFILRAKDSKHQWTPVFLAPIHKKCAIGCMIAVLWLLCASVAMNNVIAAAGLQQISESYRQVEQTFYSSTIWIELLALGVVTPLAEELLYRQLVYGRLREDAGKWTAIFASALIFGVLHGNLVQAVYAIVLGICLALLMETYQDVRVPFFGHAAANCIAILRGETDLFSWLSVGEPLFWPVTVILLVVMLLLMLQFLHNLKS